MDGTIGAESTFGCLLGAAFLLSYHREGDSPLERLVDMYRKEGRVGELLGIYRVHLAQYPADERARTVLVRLLLSVGDPQAPAALRTAIAQHEDNAYLRFLRQH